ncbi:MAG: PBP1A family penicillin-binding protein [Bdellovibrionaceae bacterium]|nr:PBP1A family penicillin-binding protein [Pseudobdellovibrionaceae bacterium]
MKHFITKIIQLKTTHKILILFTIFAILFIAYFTWIFIKLPKLFNVSDYQPALLSEVYDQNEKKIGEFFKQRRIISSYEDMPLFLIQAFISAEDGSFFSHKGLNYRAILRAFMANLKAGKKVQGGSTITQQLSRALLLSTEKTYTRKFKEAILSLRMENSLTKQDILYIYLNQIYLGHGAYGVEMASRTYFRKSVKDITIAEAALLAGLPKAPSRFSPVFNPGRAKSRQIYVLNRMRQEGYITEDEMNKHLNEDIKIFVRKDFSAQSPYYLETVRRLILKYIEEKDLLEKGLKIYTFMDFEKQRYAQQAVKKGLEEWDKRQGFRGIKKNLSNLEEQKTFMEEEEKKLRSQLRSDFILPGFALSLDPETEEIPPEFYIKFKEKFKLLEEQNKSSDFWFKRKKQLAGKIFSSLISQVEEDKIILLTPWGKEVLTLEDFEWAVPVENKEDKNLLDSAREVFKVNDVISVKVKEIEEENQLKQSQQGLDKNIELTLYQEPLAEASLISFDLENSKIIAMVGGYNYNRSQYNRAYQARRQSGSVFKPFVYGAALERKFRPNTLVSDSPIVFTPKEAEEKKEAQEEDLSTQDLWRPVNYSNRFLGDVLFRQALISSLNVPTARVIEKTGLNWVRFYVRRLGIFSPLNPDFTMALGSSSLTLYETLKAFSVFAKQGQGIQPLLIDRIEDNKGEELVSSLGMDDFFIEEIAKAEEFVLEEKSRWFKEDSPEEDQSDFQKRWQALLNSESNQLIPANSSYVLMNLLEAVIQDPEGTGHKAIVLDRPVGGKTGTTNGNYDTWFVGASPIISTAVWLGFDNEKSLGKAETGARTALPIWIDYMKKSHEDLAPVDFPVPDEVVFANIDGETGGLVSSKSREVIHQAFVKGTEPQDHSDKENLGFSGEDSLDLNETEFIKEDLSY